MIVEPARRDEFLALMRETYADGAMSEAEFEWWFDRNPVPPRVVSAARDEDGTTLGVLAMSPVRTGPCLAACSVHGVTTPAARGRGVFSTLELHNEREAAAAGAKWALGFTNPMAGPILVGKLGWEDVASLRIWARPKRLWRRGEGGMRAAELSSVAPRSLPGRHIVRDDEYLRWRYADSPRRYAQAGNAIVTHAVWHGYSSAVICESGVARDLRRAAAAVDANLAVALVNPGEERRYIAAGFVPTPRTIRFIGKRLTDDAPPLPHDRRAWHLELGDVDFF